MILRSVKKVRYFFHDYQSENMKPANENQFGWQIQVKKVKSIWGNENLYDLESLKFGAMKIFTTQDSDLFTT